MIVLNQCAFLQHHSEDMIFYIRGGWGEALYNVHYGFMFIAIGRLR